MAADLFIHVLDGECTEEDIAVFNNHCLGSKHYMTRQEPRFGTPEYDRLHRVVSSTPQIWVGEVSWLKAMVFEDAETFVPSTVRRVAEIIGEELPTVDARLISEVRAAFKLKNTTGYRLATAREVVIFLRQHEGKRVFQISW